jgi:hypothetical protein
MSELDYIGADELVFNNDVEKGIHSGGFSVKSIMMKAGMSPIMTVNTEQIGGNNDKVSDLFDNLVIPNWTLSYNNRIIGGKYKEVEHNLDLNHKNKTYNKEQIEDDDDVVDDDLHEKLLDLVKQHNNKIDKPNKKITRKMRNKKRGTKKRKLN